MRRLESKVILVAGAGSIGNECARRYASEGAFVVLGDLRIEIAESAVDDIKRAGGVATATRIDGGDEASIRDAVKLSCKIYGGLDGLHANFNNHVPGIDQMSVLDMPLEAFDQIMHVNARGYFLCTRYAVPQIVARGGGAVIYTSSGSATVGEPTRAPYAMSKAAGQALMRHVAIKFGPQGVRANAVAPGVVMREATPYRGATTPEIQDIARKSAPIARIGKPSDIAATCALLMSDEGSYITGQVLNIDGGVTMRP
jgi:NAD(P)-dependent dehydrogenase (short-subunit alcohol dehydrogenase family)